MKKLLFLLSLFGVTFFGCIEEVDFSVPQPSPVPTIQGQLTLGDPSVVEILIETIFETNSSLPRPVISARVTLFDDQGGELTIPHLENGLYRAEIPAGSSELDVRVGGSYFIEVRLADQRVFRTTPEAIYPVPAATDLSVRQSSRTELTEDGSPREIFTLQYDISTPLQTPGATEMSRLRWIHEATYAFTDTPDDPSIAPKTCYARNRPGQFEVFILDGNDLAINTLEDYDLLEVEPNSNYAEGNVMTVYQQSLSPATYRYFFSVEDLVTRTGNMFESIPASVPTNVVNTTDPDDLVLGWFYATVQDTIRLYVSPDFARNPGTACPQPPSMSPNPPPNRCDDCVLQLGATLQRPGYFPG
jgi:hypothetical protein